MPSILSDGTQIHFEERGTGPPLILLMGLGRQAACGPTTSRPTSNISAAS